MVVLQQPLAAVPYGTRVADQAASPLSANAGSVQQARAAREAAASRRIQKQAGRGGDVVACVQAGRKGIAQVGCLQEIRGECSERHESAHILRKNYDII